jgi:archaeal flagellin FlaB
MYQKFSKTIKNLLVGQKGMTGLETAIILIAFVTVASVLAYSVLSAGIFSAERGKATVYGGLQQAQSSLDVKGAVIGTSADNDALTTLVVNLGLVNPTEQVDSAAIHLTLITNNVTEQLTTDDFTLAILPGSTERGAASMIERDEVWQLTVTIPADATIAAYESFTLQVIPPTGASLQIKRALPGYLDSVIPLN